MATIDDWGQPTDKLAQPSLSEWAEAVANDVKTRATVGYVDSRIWYGTQAEYDALPEKDPRTLYCIAG